MIPELKDTPDAIRFGKVATPVEVKELEERRFAVIRLVELKKSKGQLQEAFDLAFKAQFYREALEAYRGEAWLTGNRKAMSASACKRGSE